MSRLWLAVCREESETRFYVAMKIDDPFIHSVPNGAAISNLSFSCILVRVRNVKTYPFSFKFDFSTKLLVDSYPVWHEYTASVMVPQPAATKSYPHPWYHNYSKGQLKTL